ncbi:hypothetical protein XENORESO_020282 [Xenotaenia resolanae]|uniref:Uncharacterized protein n=1 Tax=Xenotaenia resolanae TaxID=208358 RepID=A0ABV0VTH1_9TELE
MKSVTPQLSSELKGWTLTSISFSHQMSSLPIQQRLIVMDTIFLICQSAAKNLIPPRPPKPCLGPHPPKPCPGPHPPKPQEPGYPHPSKRPCPPAHLPQCPEPPKPQHPSCRLRHCLRPHHHQHPPHHHAPGHYPQVFSLSHSESCIWTPPSWHSSQTTFKRLQRNSYQRWLGVVYKVILEENRGLKVNSFTT